MGAIKQNIPNFITCLNLACGFIGIVFLVTGKAQLAVYPIFIAAFFDFFDGFMARLLKVTSTVGRDLDSLADIVTFGVLPGIMVYQLMDHYPRVLSLHYFIDTGHLAGIGFYDLLSYVAALIPVFSAIRLARFNNDPTQRLYFKGLPTPANGIVIASFYYWILFESDKHRLVMLEDLVFFPWSLQFTSILLFFYNPFVLAFITILMSYLLVSNIKLMAFKFKGFSWKDNQWKYILLIVSFPLVIFLGFASAPIILFLYIIISQIHFRSVCP